MQLGSEVLSQLKFVPTAVIEKITEVDSLENLYNGLASLHGKQLINTQMIHVLVKLYDLHLDLGETHASKEVKTQILEYCLQLCKDEISLADIKACCEHVEISWPNFISQRINMLLHNEVLSKGLLTNLAYQTLELLSPDIVQAARSKILTVLIVYACEDGKIPDLKYFYENFKDDFIIIANSVDCTSYKDFLVGCIEHDFPEKFKYISRFNNQPDKIDHDAGLVACAAIAESSTIFKPVLLDGLHNFNDLRAFFSLIEAHKKQINGEIIRFVSTGEHWFSGVIQIKDDQINLLFIDPLGKDSFNEGYFFHDIKHPVDIANECFSNLNVNVIDIKRQHDGRSCAVFTLDDARKLFKINDFFTDLPINMIRTTQSMETIMRLKKLPAYAAHLTEAVNKKGLNLQESVDEHTANIEDELGNRKTINKRIESKFANLETKVWKFLNTHSAAEIDDIKQKFSLTNFEESLERKNRTNENGLI
jgi:hypothetical protein